MSSATLQLLTRTSRTGPSAHRDTRRVQPGILIADDEPGVRNESEKCDFAN